jgi:pimeloyl-ACP methyl ester carboxylesterase
MLDFPRVATLVLSAALTGSVPVFAQSTCFEGVQASGSIYRICLPSEESYNGSVVIWAHGFQDATESVQIPEDQLHFGDVYLPDLVNGLGFGFATNSYSKTGLAVLQGMEDILDLVTIYEDTVGRPGKVYLVGASEGGIITTLLVEQYPQIFEGGLAACGPIGDFIQQINYFGDARATFEYYFPGLIPGEPFQPPEWLVESWSADGGYYETFVEPVLLAPENAAARDEWVGVARLPYDKENYEETVMTSIRDVLNYAVVNQNDAAETLGGFPFDNARTWYSGASDPRALNASVPRTTADPEAIAEMRRNYTTSGVLKRPLMTMHTLLDQQVPYWHEPLYTQKNLESDSFVTQRLNLPVNRYGHCNFTVEEALFMFMLLLRYNGDLHLILPALQDAMTVDAEGNITLHPAGQNRGDHRETLRIQIRGEQAADSVGDNRSPRRR